MALVIGAVLALAAVAFVLYPLLAPNRQRMRQALAPEEVPGSTAVEALREIEFDRQTGKLSDADYTSLKASYTERALAELRSEPVAEPAPSPQDVPAQRLTCPECGPRPESDAAYCSDCGRYLAGACVACGAPVTETGARYCAGCGNALAA
jgi:cytochrome c-type biogenesis protein CcmI